MAALEVLEGGWARSGEGPGEVAHHTAIVAALTESDAVRAVREIVMAYGSFDEFVATLARDRHGEVVQTPIRRFWDDIDWEDVESKATLTELERALLRSITLTGEATWIILNEPDVPNDRDQVVAVLEELEERNLVRGTLEVSFDPAREPYSQDRWWALTDEAWDLLGLIKRPWYR
jgi:hypothetical protein